MTDSIYISTVPSSPGEFDETIVIDLGDQAGHIDRCFRLLANRRRRFYLYYLLWEDTPIPMRRLAEMVETSLAPPESAITDRIVEDALAKLVHSHLPKLREAGLVRVNDEMIEVAPNPALPIQDWLPMVAEVELNP